MTPTSRLYSHPDDLPKLIEFLKIVRPAAWIGEFPNVIDLQESMNRSSIREMTRLWIDDQRELAAFAFVLEPYNNFVFEAKADMDEEIENELISWGIECADPSMETLDTSCREDDTERIVFLEHQGFVRLEENTLRLSRDLEEPIPPPQLPEGFTIRCLTGESEVDFLVALHQAAFGTSNMAREERLAIMRAPEYDPTLDLIVIAPDKRFAAYCTCSISTVENKLSGVKVGHTDPVAVHPDFQGRGLAQGLLLTGARLLKERGMTLAMLGTGSENLPMQKAAEAAGYRVYSKKLWFAKALP
jgi:mycothiol synthase